MISDNELAKQIPYVLDHTDFSFLGKKYSGKVRDNYSSGDIRYLVTTDRLSCFDVIVTTVPFKGQVLNQLAVSWFKKTAHIVPNHIVDVPDPSVMVARSCEVVPVEVVVRGYLAGSSWRDYQAGREISGIRLPPGLRQGQKLPENMLTPSTKAAKGSHDMPISETDIVSQGLVSGKLWEEIRKASLALFSFGQKEAEKNGLILVDTKYEFGTSGGKLYLVDEIHTLDSSRYWVASTYKERFEKGESPEMLDKEPTRQWLLSKGFDGNGTVPEFTPEHRVKIARHYIDSYQKISGTEFVGEVGDVTQRIDNNLKNYQKSRGL